MIKEVSHPTDCPFRYETDWADYCCTISDENCIWNDNFPKSCPLIKERNILIKFNSAT